MEAEQLLMYQQKVSSVLDTLLTKTLNGISVAPKDLDKYNETINRLTRLLIELSDQIALERCQKLNQAVLMAFQKMEQEMDKRFLNLENNKPKDWREDLPPNCQS